MGNWEYDIKCRKCGKITRMFHSTHEQTKAKDFEFWAIERGAFPMEKQCDCDNGMIMLHDIISFGGSLALKTNK